LARVGLAKIAARVRSCSFPIGCRHLDGVQGLRTGSRIKALPPEQLRQLRQQIDRKLAEPSKPLAPQPARKAKPPKATAAKKKPLTRDEFNRRLMTAGLITRLPDPALDIDDDDPEDQPIAIEGEPLSETIIRERR
jgi:hypothetical protein